MIKKEWIYNDECLVILPSYHEDKLEAFEYSFKNVMILDFKDGVRDQIDIICNNNFKQLIFVDYMLEYNEMISYLKKKHIIKIIFTKALGALPNEFNTIIYNGVMSLIKNNNIKNIAFLDKNLYEVYKKSINCYHIRLDIPIKSSEKNFDKKRIGILNNSDNHMHSYYNSLSALKFNDYTANIKKLDPNTKDFLSLFDIKYKENENNYSNNLVNLYINFSDNDNLVFLKSMDANVPCILGNNELLKGTELEKLLMVKSDDNIDEISQKIEEVAKNREKINKIYKEYRKAYSENSRKEISTFLELKEEKKEIRDKDEYLISIVVPVYNTEQYLAKCLDSIIKAIPKRVEDKIEILVINDGSTDNSEKVIEKYQEKYKKLIKGIKQENHGLGNVRNVGLKISKGKYIASIDSDDTINEDFFESCIDDLLNDVDIVINNWLTITDTGNYETSAIDWVFKKNSLYEGLLYTTIMPSTCNKIIKKELYTKLNIKFLEDKYEDLSTNPLIMLEAKTIRYINKPYYEYYIRSNSIMRSSAGLSMINVIKELDNRLENNKDLFNIDIEKFKYYTYSWRIEEYIMNPMYSIEEDKIDEYIGYINDNIFEIITKIFENKYYKEMLSNLKDDKREYISKRNKAIKEKKLISFLKNNKDIIKLTPPIIYYGDK